MSGREAEDPPLLALLVGVDRYLQPRLPEPVSYPSLAGAMADVERMEELLLRRLAVPPERIRKLTASHGDGGEPPEPPDARPTYENLVAGFRWLRETARPGEQVLVHYSGHGGRARTTLEEAKGPDGLDECLVPYDFSRSGRYLRDTEIQVLIRELVDARFQTTLVFDCCHAGGTLREGFEGRVAVRGIDEIDRAPRPRDSLVASSGELAAAWRSFEDRRREAGGGPGGTAWRGFAGSRSFGDAPWGYVLLAACRPHESAYEAAFDEGLKWEGALTHHLLQALWEGGSRLSYRRLYDRLLARIHCRFPSQTPQLEGEGDRVVLGRQELPTRYGVTILEGEEPDRPGRVGLATGQVHGVGKGAVFALYPASAVEAGRDERRLAVVEVVEIGATRSVAAITERSCLDQPVQSGDQAVLLDPGELLVRRPVERLGRALAGGSGGGSRPSDDVRAEAASLARLEAALSARGSGFLDLEPDAAAGIDGFTVQVDDLGNYQILDAGGCPLPNLRPEIPVDAPEAAERLVQRLDHLARFRNVRQLENRDPAAALRGKLHVDFQRLPGGYKAGEPPAPEPFPAAGPRRVRVGEWVCLTVRNRSDQVLNLAVLDLQPSWVIVQIYPSRTRGLFEPLEPNDLRRIPLRAELPPGYSEGVDVVKVFATVGPVSYRWLELPPLDEPCRGDGLAGEPFGDLERLFAALAVEASALRGERPPPPPIAGWWVEQLEVGVSRP